MENFDDSIKHEFLTEAREMLEEVESKFLDLERNPDDRPTMDHIFRLAHTVKGSSFAAGFEDLGSFAHTFETLLNLLREGKAEATPHIVDLLLRSNDTLRQFVEGLTEDFDAKFDVSDITAELLESIGTDGAKKWDGPAFAFFDDEPAAKPAPEVKAEVKPEVAPKPQAAATPAPATNTVKTPQSLPVPPPGVNLASAQGPKVLVCDDEPQMIELAFEMLRMRFPTLGLISAADGLEALAKIEAHKPHVIITDLKMPNLNGIEFVKRVRKVDSNVPVIFFSGFADRENMIEFIKLGVVDFHDKPIDSERLYLSVTNALKLCQTREGITRLSTLNFKAYMATLKLSQFRPDQKTEFAEASKKVKETLDEVAILTNFILGL